MNELDLAYAAGIIDGEGCISIVKRNWSTRTDKYHLKVRVAMCDKPVVDWFHRQFGGSLSCRPRHSVNTNHRNLYTWCVSHRKAGVFLQLILPYLKLKTEQAEIGIAFQATKYCGGAIGKLGRPVKSDAEFSQNEQMYLRMRELKHLNYGDENASTVRMGGN